jgi:hypothetical protein
VVAAGTFEFRRGFLSKAERRFKTSTEALRESPAWATVEETSASGAELTSPAMRSLKRLVGSDAGDLLAAKTPWRFEAVDCAVGDLDEFRQLLETSLLPRLSVLRIGHAEGRSIDSAKWIAGLTRIVAAELQLRANFHEPVANWILAATPLTGLEVLVLEDDLGTKWRFSRDAQRKLSRLELQVSETRYPKETKERLAAIPGGVLSEFTFTGSNDAEYLELGRARVAAPAQKAEKPATRRLTEKDSFRQIAWGKEGWWVAERDRIALVDPQSGALVRAFQINPADRFQFTNDRVVAGGGSSVRAYSLETGKVEVTLGTGAGGVQDLMVSRDGRFGLVAAEYHAYFFDLQERRVLRKAKAKIYYSGAVSSDGGRFATPLEVRERPSPGVDVIQVMDGKPGSRSVKFGSDVVEPAWLPDGRIICCNRNQHRLLVFDSVTGAQQLVIEGGLEFPTTPVVSPTGKHATCWSDSKLALLDLVTGKVLWQQTPRANQAPVAFSPDGSQVVVGCAIPEVFQVHG